MRNRLQLRLVLSSEVVEIEDATGEVKRGTQSSQCPFSTRTRVVSFSRRSHDYQKKEKKEGAKGIERRKVSCRSRASFELVSSHLALAGEGVQGSKSGV